ncbi:MAG: NAD(+) diphosphatase [Pseudomonadota bacterium]
MAFNFSYFLQQNKYSGNESLLLFSEGDILHCNENIFWSMTVLEKLNVDTSHLLMIGEFQGRPCLTFNLNNEHFLQLDAEKISLRQMLHKYAIDVFSLAGRANQLLHWYDSHQFCGKCGARTQVHASEQVLICPSCQLSFYPRISPCVIVLIIRGDEILLARHAGKSSAFYSCLAGFMEVGETPEDTVIREVREEVGIEIHNIRYIQSQSWPFPSQLMLGFFADYKSGEIQVDGKEIMEANWYGPHDLPITPAASISVAGQLIKLFLQRFESRETNRF